MTHLFASLVGILALTPTVNAQDASSAVSCQTRVQSLQDYLNQDLTAITPDCKKELDESLSASSTTSCFNDPLQAVPTVSGGGTGANAAARSQAAAYKLTDQSNQTQMNYCYLHLNRINASCTPEESKFAVRALNDYAACSNARSLAARQLAAQTGQVAQATSSNSAYVQTASMKGVAMSCYLGVCAASGLMGAAATTMNPTLPIQHSVEDMETMGASQPKPRSPSSAQDIP